MDFKSSLVAQLTKGMKSRSMQVYLFASLSLVLMGILYVKPNPSISSEYRKRFSERLAIFCSFTILFIVSAFRGAFTSDYRNYIWLFKYVNNFSFDEMFSYGFQQEIGYVLLNRLIGLFTSDGLYLMIATSFLILFLFYSELIRESANLWLSILMFVTIGAYYGSFNITRQIIAAAIVFASSRFLYRRDFGRYFACILLATLFHRTSFIMVLMYFVLNTKLNLRNALVALLSFYAIFTFSDRIFLLTASLLNYGYTLGSYGTNQLGYTSVIVPTAVFCFVLFHFKLLDMNKAKDRIMFNAILFYFFFSILGTRLMLLERFTEFFVSYSFLIIPKIVRSYRNPLERLFIYFIAATLLVSYNYYAISKTGYVDYYFIWESWIR